VPKLPGPRRYPIRAVSEMTRRITELRRTHNAPTTGTATLAPRQYLEKHNSLKAFGRVYYGTFSFAVMRLGQWF